MMNQEKKGKLELLLLNLEEKYYQILFLRLSKTENSLPDNQNLLLLLVEALLRLLKKKMSILIRNKNSKFTRAELTSTLCGKSYGIENVIQAKRNRNIFVVKFFDEIKKKKFGDFIENKEMYVERKKKNIPIEFIITEQERPILTSLFVKGIPRSWDEEDLKNFIGKELATKIWSAEIWRERESNFKRSLGCGTIAIGSKETAKALIAASTNNEDRGKLGKISFEKFISKKKRFSADAELNIEDEEEAEVLKERRLEPKGWKKENERAEKPPKKLMDKKEEIQTSEVLKPKKQEKKPNKEDEVVNKLHELFAKLLEANRSKAESWLEKKWKKFGGKAKELETEERGNNRQDESKEEKGGTIQGASRRGWEKTVPKLIVKDKNTFIFGESIQKEKERPNTSTGSKEGNIESQSALSNNINNNNNRPMPKPYVSFADNISARGSSSGSSNINVEDRIGEDRATRSEEIVRKRPREESNKESRASNVRMVAIGPDPSEEAKVFISALMGKAVRGLKHSLPAPLKIGRGEVQIEGFGKKYMLEATTATIEILTSSERVVKFFTIEADNVKEIGFSDSFCILRGVKPFTKRNLVNPNELKIYWNEERVKTAIMDFTFAVALKKRLELVAETMINGEEVVLKASQFWEIYNKSPILFLRAKGQAERQAETSKQAEKQPESLKNKDARMNNRNEEQIDEMKDIEKEAEDAESQNHD